MIVRKIELEMSWRLVKGRKAQLGRVTIIRNPNSDIFVDDELFGGYGNQELNDFHINSSNR